MATLAASLDELIVRKPTQFKGLTVFPVTLINDDFARSEEEFNIVGEGRVNQYINPIETGDMDSIKVSNRAKTRAIIMDGATIKGGAGNRMFLTSAVLGHNDVQHLPVCSIEQGRWEIMKSASGKSYLTTKDVTFRRSDIATPELRRMKFQKTAAVLEHAAKMEIDQDLVWREIKSQLSISQVKSRTHDLHAIYAHWIYILFMFTSKILPQQNQIGMITFLDKNIWYADFFINESTLRKAYEPLVKSYAVEALVSSLKPGKKANVKEAEREHAEDVLSALRLAKLKEYTYDKKTAGETFFINSKRALGTALMENGKCLYATVCSK